MEEWRDIPGYEGLYQVSNLGRVKSLFRYRVSKGGCYCPVVEKIKAQKLTKDGYFETTLCKNKQLKSIRVHRLVAQAFIPNPNNYSVINHIDENPKNNKVENLEWCTVAYNSSYGTARERCSITRNLNQKQSKPVLQLDLNNNVIKKWLSIHQIHKELGYARAVISACCNNKPHNKTAYGYIWKFA